MNRPTFVFDVDIPPFLDNRVFDSAYARQYPGAEALAALGSSLRDAGLETVTADVYLDGPDAGRPAVCLSNELTRFTGRLLSLGSVVPDMLNVKYLVYDGALYDQEKGQLPAVVAGLTTERLKGAASSSGGKPTFLT